MLAVRSSLELIVGAASRGDFGPMLLFGEGGAAVEVVADTALELPPLNLKLAQRMLERTRVFRKMRGFRNVPAVDVDAVALVLMRVSQLVVDWPRRVAWRLTLGYGWPQARRRSPFGRIRASSSRT